MQKTAHILICDDQPIIHESLGIYLESEGFTHASAYNGVQAVQMAESESPDLILMDLMMPEKNGMDACREIRQKSNVPIIMLTARGSDSDRIAGLEAGADDYLPKPFNPNELLARIRAVLRRQVREVPGAPSQQVEVVSFGPWALDLSTRTLTREGQVVTLTTGEFAVLKALVQHPREPLTRDKLMNLARGREWGAMERSIDVQVSRLRRLIEDNPARARYIQTVWGVGYVFVPDGAE